MGYAGMVEEVASAAKSRVHLLGPPDDVDDLAKARPRHATFAASCPDVLRKSRGHQADEV